MSDRDLFTGLRFSELLKSHIITSQKRIKQFKPSSAVNLFPRSMADTITITGTPSKEKSKLSVKQQKYLQHFRVNLQSRSGGFKLLYGSCDVENNQVQWGQPAASSVKIRTSGVKSSPAEVSTSCCEAFTEIRSSLDSVPTEPSCRELGSVCPVSEGQLNWSEICYPASQRSGLRSVTQPVRDLLPNRSEICYPAGQRSVTQPV